MPMKVIHFVTAIDRSLGGVSMYMQLLTKELGKIVDLIVVTRPTQNPLLLENCKVIYLPLPVSQLGNFRKQWIDILEEEHPDVVHINGIWMIQTWIIQREALKRGIRTYITLHGMLEPWILNRHPLKKKFALFLFQKKALKSATALIATADSEKENILQLGYNMNVITIPNGVDVANVGVKKGWKINKRILYMSRLHQKKGIELLLEVLEDLKDRLRNYEVIIAGEGESVYVASLKKRVGQIDSVNIVFVGGVYGERKWELYRNSDFFILPSYSENFGYVIAESLACGIPVITTQGTPWRDLETYHCGCWVRRDKDSLKQAVSHLLSLSDDELKELGSNGRKLVEEKYSTKSVAVSLYNMYLQDKV